MLSVGGITLSCMFMADMALHALLDIDITLAWKSSWWTQETHLWGGSMAYGHLILRIFGLLLDSILVAVSMPFLAALRHASQKSTFEMSV